MKAEQISIEKITPYDFNNRNHSKEQVALIAKSIKEFGFNQPLVLDENYTILVGHGRLLAAQELKMAQVPTIVLNNLTEAQKKAYRILDNKLQNDSTWSFDNLELELGFLEDNDFDLKAWGLDDLRDLFPEPELEATEDDFEPQEQTETYIKRGDIIELGRHRVMCGDSTRAEDVTGLLEGKEPVLMVTDPPYGVEYDPNWRNEAAEKGLISYAARSIGKVENDERIDWREAYELFNAQVIYVWHAGRHHAAELSQNLIDAGYNIISQIIWAKPMFAISRGDYHWQHEPCWYAVKEGKNHNWQGSRSESTLWEIERGCKEKTGHGTEKPMECMAKPIKNNSAKGEIIADAFLGSGTTLIACEQLNRTCYGMEISPQYCQVIIDRYKAYCEKNNKKFECKINGEAFSGSPE